MADSWALEGPWLKNCNCDPGCPCDFNQAPTTGQCEAIFGMRIDKGHFGDVSLDGVKWVCVVWWPGRMDEGEGQLLPIVDESADEDQRQAVLTVLSGEAGGTFFEIIAAICPYRREPVFAPIDFEFDIESRTGRLKAGEVIETEVEPLRGIGSSDPYRILVNIPGGFEYTGDSQDAEIALATSLKVRGGDQLDFEHTNSHSSMTFVKHEGQVPATA